MGDILSLLPTITRDGMLEVDRIMVEDLAIPLHIMVEQAGLNLAKLAVKYAKSHKCDRFLVISGDGNNGSGGLVSARRLASWGLDVTVILPKGEPTRKIPILEFNRVKSMGVSVSDSLDIIADPGTLVIDAYIGYNFQYRVDPLTDTVFDFLRESKIVSLDLASGIDSTTGQNISGLTPLATITIAWPKRAFRYLTSDSVGDLYVMDIGVPSSVYMRDNILDNAILPSQLDELNRKFAEESVIPIDIGIDGWKFE